MARPNSIADNSITRAGQKPSKDFRSFNINALSFVSNAKALNRRIRREIPSFIWHIDSPSKKRSQSSRILPSFAKTRTLSKNHPAMIIAETSNPCLQSPRVPSFLLKQLKWWSINEIRMYFGSREIGEVNSTSICSQGGLLPSGYRGTWNDRK